MTTISKKVLELIQVGGVKTRARRLNDALKVMDLYRQIDEIKSRIAEISEHDGADEKESLESILEIKFSEHESRIIDNEIRKFKNYEIDFRMFREILTSYSEEESDK